MECCGFDSSPENSLRTSTSTSGSKQSKEDTTHQRSMKKQKLNPTESSPVEVELEVVNTASCLKDVTIIQLRVRNGLLRALSTALSEAGSLPVHQDHIRALLSRLHRMSTDTLLHLTSYSVYPPPIASEEDSLRASGHLEALWLLLGIDHRVVI